MRKHQAKWTILNYAEMSYKQYAANPARRMTRFDEATYIRNENKYDEKIRLLYACKCHQEAIEQHKQQCRYNKSKEELRRTIKTAHPDKRNGKEDRRKEFEDALEEIRKPEMKKPTSTRRCCLCEVNRQMAEQYLSNVEMVLRRAQKPLPPEDFVSSIHYTPCYEKVIAEDMKRHGEGDLTLFEDIRRLSHL